MTTIQEALEKQGFVTMNDLAQQLADLKEEIERLKAENARQQKTIAELRRKLLGDWRRE